MYRQAVADGVVVLAVIAIVFVSVVNLTIGLALAFVFAATFFYLVNQQYRRAHSRHSYPHISAMANKRRNATRDLYGDDSYGLFKKDKKPPKKTHGSWDDNPDQAPPINFE